MDAATAIRRARIRRGLTQTGLARRAGTTQPVVSAYENSKRDPSVETLRRLVAATGERLEIGLAERESEVSTTSTPRERGEALVDVLLLADAIPLRREPERNPSFPRMVSTR